MNRRKFFAFLPFAPVSAVMATSAAAKAPCESLAPEKELMTLKAYKAPPPSTPVKYPSTSITYNVMPPNRISFGSGLDIKADQNFDTETKVSMAVGKDGHLWLKIGDNWKRVVTE